MSQLLADHDHIHKTLESVANLDVANLEFEKLFDKVDHGVLFLKKQDLGMKGTAGRWIVGRWKVVYGVTA